MNNENMNFNLDNKADLSLSEKAIALLCNFNTNKALARPCQCCEAENIPQDQLKKIDSGQLLCPSCFAELKRCSESAN
jgi:hypothetical protein